MISTSPHANLSLENTLKADISDDHNLEMCMDVWLHETCMLTDTSINLNQFSHVQGTPWVAVEPLAVQSNLWIIVDDDMKASIKCYKVGFRSLARLSTNQLCHVQQSCLALRCLRYVIAHVSILGCWPMKTFVGRRDAAFSVCSD